MTTPAPDHGITAQAVSAHTGGLVAADTPGLDRSILGTVAAIRRWCGWHIWPSRTVVLHLDGPGTDALRLPSLYVTAVESVIEDGTTLSFPSDYTWSRNGWLTRKGARLWTCEDQGVQAAITHGYDDAPDLEGLVLTAVARNINNPLDLTNMSVGDRAEGYRGGGPPPGVLGNELATLSQYRIVR